MEEKELTTPAAESDTARHFLRQWIEEDLAAGKNDGTVVTRFPPEPNGWIHIGHAKAVWVDFGMAKHFNGSCHLRMDDTNPSKETDEFVEQLKQDITWLGYKWDKFFYACDMFETMWDIAEELIRRGQAYVCDLTQEEWKAYRGIPQEPGRFSPYRDRSVEENLTLFRRMRAGDFAEGTHCLRAKIDMASPNIHFRDPVIYRIVHQPHYHTGDTWHCYPMYDFAHPIEDALEGVTHSMCTLEFEVHRPLYDWVIDRLEEQGRLVVRNGKTIRPQQREFARLNLTYTVMSKRLLRQLVEEGHVDGWDDPRMPTVAGMRRRGYPAAAIRDLCERTGISKYKSLTDLALLEWCVRDELNRNATRRMAVLNPVKLIIDNLPEGVELTAEVPNNPENESAGKRTIHATRELWIDRDDFMEVPVKKFFRVTVGNEVRLRGLCLFTCTHVVKDEQGVVTEIHGTYDPVSKGGNPSDGRKVKGTIHWVSAAYAKAVEVRLYDRLFALEDPMSAPSGNFLDALAPESVKVITGYVEPHLAEARPGEYYQFERVGYFTPDIHASKPGAPVFNRTVTLKDSFKAK
ncbi:MAG: glutamine--tRNA ligase/YqeY domain fusion protein [Kiritimatiellae bacterium]|nr:glutamine--tRNA ligase/YqeY domain fusion protein [Kiritimatiellia bacterium]